MAAGVSSPFLRSMSDRWDWPIPLRLDSSFWVSTRSLRKSTTRRPRLNWTYLPSITRADIALVDVEFVEGLHVVSRVEPEILERSRHARHGKHHVGFHPHVQ